MSSDLFASTMKAACYFQHGGAQIDIVHSYPKPILQPGDLLIKVMTASVNPVDIKLHQNNFRNNVLPLPKVPGRDFCGVVEEMSEPSGRWKIGDRVMGLLPDIFKPWGTCSEYVSMNELRVVKVPASMSEAEAASLPFVSTVVMQALAPFVDSCEDTTDKKILIQGGAGGVGSFAIQYCTNVLNMQVTTTCSPNHNDFCTSLGATAVIDYNKVKFDDVITDFDVVLDPFSYLYKKRTMNSKVLHANGWYIALKSSPHSLNVFLRSRKVTSIPETRSMGVIASKWEHIKVAMGVARIHYHSVSIVPDEATLPRVMALVEQGLIHPCVDKTFEMEDIMKAHRYVETGHVQGKVIIRVSEGTAINSDQIQIEI